MTPRPIRLAMLASALVIAPLSAPFAIGQSGSRNTANPSSSAPYGSATRIPNDGSSDPASKVQVGLQGYCPVCLVEMRQWIKGDPRLFIEFDGKKYLFQSAKQAKKFEDNPLKYVPVVAGDDIVILSRSGRRTEGRLDFGVVHKGRTYFFASAENKRLFQTSPESFENADLALGGECIVCRVDMNQRVRGDAKYTALFQGLRYQFPGEEQRSAFLRSPVHYVREASLPSGQTPVGSGTRPSGGPQTPPGGSGTR